MKICFFISILPFLFGMCNSDRNSVSSLRSIEENNPLDTIPYYDKDIPIFVEFMPRFPGCEDIDDLNKKKSCSDGKIISFINKHLKYPPIAKNHGIEGTIVARFIIEKDGSLSFHKNKRAVLLKDPGAGLGEEFIRVLKLMPKWEPAIQDGIPVRVIMTIPLKIHPSFD